MGSPQSLSFLRPYMASPLQVRTPAYTRFYSLTKCPCQNYRDQGLVRKLVYTTSPEQVGWKSIGSSDEPENGGEASSSQSPPPPASRGPQHPTAFLASSSSSSPAGPHEVWNSPLPEPIAHFNNLGAGIRDRIGTLYRNQALSYPRMSPPEAGKPRMRIREFKDKFGRADLNKTHDSPHVTLTGRVQSIRRSGSKLAFIDITQEFETIQVMVSWSKIYTYRPTRGCHENYFDKLRTILRLVRRGDIISVSGHPYRSNLGAVGLAAIETPTILSPAIAALPESLQEGRMLNRHVDLLVNPQSWGTLLLRSRLTQLLRLIFAKQQFLEVSTPILASHASGATATPFETHLQSEQLTRPLALRIAPELWLKRLVVGGFDRIFEIGPAFRNEGQDPSHNPEFTMCEFYQSYATLDDLITWTQRTFHNIALQLDAALSVHERLQSRLPSKIAIKAFCDKNTNPSAHNYPRVQFLPELEKKLRLRFRDLELHLPGARDRLVKALADRNALEEHELNNVKDMSKIFDSLAAKYLEVKHPGRPFFIIHQPAFMSPLSKWMMCPVTNVPVAARAEFFFNGMELANMYEEENSPFEQRRKFLAQLNDGEDWRAWMYPSILESESGMGNMRALNGGGAERGNSANTATAAGQRRQGSFVDEQYVETLLAGMPPTGGWGCGIDRLVMIFSGKGTISETLPFGSLRHVRAFAERSRILASGGK